MKFNQEELLLQVAMTSHNAMPKHYETLNENHTFVSDRKIFFTKLCSMIFIQSLIMTSHNAMPKHYETLNENHTTQFGKKYFTI